MSDPKTFNNIRQTQLTDTSIRWDLKEGFIPMKGELVVIQDEIQDENQDENPIPRTSSQLKIGDGRNPLSRLSPISGSGGSGDSSLQLDTSLAIEGYAADAKAVGDRFDATIQYVQEYVNDSILGGKW